MTLVARFRRSSLLAAGALCLASAAAAQTELLGVPIAGSIPEPIVAAPTDSVAGTSSAAGSAAARVRGRSGALRAALARPLETLDPGLAGGGTARYRWEPVLGTRDAELLGEAVVGEALLAPDRPGVWQLRGEQAYAGGGAAPLTLITQVPAGELRGGRLNGYHVGSYPERSGSYAPPAGFIEVTEQNQDLAVSEHFRLRHFLTKDQRAVWPKYLVLDLRLIDKLELVLQELNAMGVRAERMHVMSGYRTPQYNGPGGDGRAALSRHTYGDAADVWVDNDADGYMDDLNGDGRADLEDARVMLRAVDRVERRFPELTGGAGVYVATSAHGPFIHVDARGSRSRW